MFQYLIFLHKINKGDRENLEQDLTSTLLYYKNALQISFWNDKITIRDPVLLNANDIKS